MHRSFTSTSFLSLSFKYKADIEYYAHSKVIIGAMDKECPHCKALMFKSDHPGCVVRQGRCNYL